MQHNTEKDATLNGQSGAGEASPLCQVNSYAFLSFNLTQFLGALNDNVYKQLMVYFLLSSQGLASRSTILTLSGAIFVLPFITLSPIAGRIADNISKTSLFRFAKFLEIAVMTLGVIAFSSNSSTLCYCVLFFMAAQSTLFGPAKYGLIPEMLAEEEIPKANGWISLFTYIAIILGTALASLLTDHFNNFTSSSYFCVFFALLGTGTSLCVPKVKSMKQGKKLSLNIIKQVKETLTISSHIEGLNLLITCNMLFFLMASFCQLNLIPFAMDSLYMRETAGGYLYPCLAIGIGIGSTLAGFYSKKRIRLDFIPKAVLGVGISLCGLWFFDSSLCMTIILLSALGLFGGFFVVPTDSFMQINSPKNDRGEVLAVSNVLAFCGVLFGSLCIGLFDHFFTPAEGFAVIGLSTIALARVLHHRIKALQIKLQADTIEQL